MSVKVRMGKCLQRWDMVESGFDKRPWWSDKDEI
jgi:hypothetical protein